MPQHSIKITILVDNHTHFDTKDKKLDHVVNDKRLTHLKAEHGFSILIETNQQRFLFDTGHAETLFHNAQHLGIKLNNLDGIILSHGHYDHGGNIAALLAINPSTTLYLHPDALLTRYSIHPGKPAKNISLGKTAIKAIQSHPTKLVKFSNKAHAINKQIYISGEIKRINPYEIHSGPFYLDKDKQSRDQLLDDQSLWIHGKAGLSVITACCHAGLVNTLNHIKQKTQAKKYYYLLGGFHLLNAEQHKLAKTIQRLNEIEFNEIFPAHCTGSNAIETFKQSVNTPIKQCYVGMTLLL